MTNEMITMEQLDQIAGGTCQETDEIIDAIGKVDYIKMKAHGRYVGPTRVNDKLTRSKVDSYLKRTYGIDADTHNGFLFLSDGAANEYSRNGETLTHQQVLNIIKGN